MAATLYYVEKDEIKARGVGLKENYSAAEALASYDDDGEEIAKYDNRVKVAVSLEGLTGMKKIDKETLLLSFYDGEEEERVNIPASKMDYVRGMIKKYRKTNKEIIGY